MQRTCSVCGGNMYVDSTYESSVGIELSIFICSACGQQDKVYINR